MHNLQQLPKKEMSEAAAWRFIAKQFDEFASLKGKTWYSRDGLCLAVVLLERAGGISVATQWSMEYRLRKERLAHKHGAYFFRLTPGGAAQRAKLARRFARECSRKKS